MGDKLPTSTGDRQISSINSMKPCLQTWVGGYDITTRVQFMILQFFSRLRAGICHPGTVTTTMTTTFAHQESSSWKVTGPCSVLGDCVQSGNYPEDYGDSDWRLNIFDVNFRASQGFTDFVPFHFVTWAITVIVSHVFKNRATLRWEMCNQDATALSDQLHHFFHRSFLWCSDGEWCWIFRYFKCRYCCSGLGQHHMVIRFKCIFWCLGIVLCEAYMLWWFAANSSGCIWLPPWNHATSELQRCLTRRALWGWWHLWYTNWHQQLLLGVDWRCMSQMSCNVWLLC